MFDEIDRLEDLLSKYRPYERAFAHQQRSREGAGNHRSGDPLRFSKRAVELSRRSDGAFEHDGGASDAGVGFLLQSRKDPIGCGVGCAEVEGGWQHIRLNPSTRSVWFDNGVSMELDPGGIGKGYAVDRAVALLRA